MVRGSCRAPVWTGFLLRSPDRGRRCSVLTSTHTHALLGCRLPLQAISEPIHGVCHQLAVDLHVHAVLLGVPQ